MYKCVSQNQTPERAQTSTVFLQTQKPTPKSRRQVVRQGRFKLHCSSALSIKEATFHFHRYFTAWQKVSSIIWLQLHVRESLYFTRVWYVIKFSRSNIAEAIFSLFQTFQTAWGAQCVQETLSPEAKQTGRQADRSPPSSAEIKSKWSCTSAPTRLHAYTATLHLHSKCKASNRRFNKKCIHDIIITNYKTVSKSSIPCIQDQYIHSQHQPNALHQIHLNIEDTTPICFSEDKPPSRKYTVPRSKPITSAEKYLQSSITCRMICY